MGQVTPENYQEKIASTLGVSETRAAAIATEYSLDSYASPTAALSTLIGDANFTSTASQLDMWTAKDVPTFAYEFNEDAESADAERHQPVHGVSVRPPVPGSPWGRSPRQAWHAGLDRAPSPGPGNERC